MNIVSNSGHLNDKKSRKLKKGLFIGMGLLVVVVLILLIVLANKDSASSIRIPYIKDNKLYITNASQTRSFLVEEDFTGFFDVFEGSVKLSLDQKLIFYMTDEKDEGRSLYYKKVSSIKNEPIKIADNCKGFFVSEKGDIVIIASMDDNFYQYNVEKDSLDIISDGINKIVI